MVHSFSIIEAIGKTAKTQSFRHARPYCFLRWSAAPAVIWETVGPKTCACWSTTWSLRSSLHGHRS